MASIWSCLRLCRLICYVAFVLLAWSDAARADKAEWTFMVYMNAKNNLEADALANFREMAEVGGSDRVNVLVEFGRPKLHVTEEEEGWDGVLRFKVEQGQAPIPSAAIVDLRSDTPELSDMGSPRALQDFVSWSMQSYPAKKYMLVIWNHGQGWRFQMAKNQELSIAATTELRFSDNETIDELKREARSTPAVGGYRTVSYDDDTGSFLYNSDIQAIVEASFGGDKPKLDVIGFDACLMSMIETAYAFRNSTSLLVSSEELEPGAGWNYVPIVKALVSNPETTPMQLSEVIVAGYEARFGNSRSTTLSILDLEKADTTAKSVSAFAGALMAALPAENNHVKNARAKMTPYGASEGLRTSVDLVTFLDNYTARTENAELKKVAEAAKAAIRQLVLLNYASNPSKKHTGAEGVAIYFPESKIHFFADTYHEGYLKANTDHVVDFVAKELWADLLAKYLEL